MQYEALREELLEQHRILRELGREIRALAERVRSGEAGVTELLRSTLGGFSDQAAAHIAYENEALVPILRGFDAWGPQREEMILEHHFEEHEALFEALDAATGAATSEEVLSAAERAIAAFVAHMDEEERTLINRKVLTDSIITVEFGG